MGKRVSKIKTNFDFFLKHFEPDPDPKVIRIDLGKGRATVQEFSIELPLHLRIFDAYIVFIIFVYIKKFAFQGYEEKVAWTIPIKFRGMPFLLQHQKFGFRIISNYDSPEIAESAKEAITNIKKAIPYAEAIIEPLIKHRVQGSNVTLDNQYKAILARYKFFRTNAVQEFHKAKEKLGKSRRVTKKMKYGEMTTTYNFARKHYLAGNNFATAMLDAYYCLIEHTLVLLVPFISTVKIGEINLEEFIGENWKQKFKIIIPLKNNKEAQKIYERLEKIKEDLRNPLTHGYFLKDGHSFYVHMPNLGAIPMTLTKKLTHFHYGFYVIHNIKFQDICKCFDDFDKFLSKNKDTKYGIKYIQSGLSVAFDEESSKVYKSAMTTMSLFKEFIFHEAMEHDNAINMDW